MSQGFGNSAADRSLMHSARRMNALRKVLEKYEHDPRGKRKMLKAMKKYYHGWRGELDRIDMKEVELPPQSEEIQILPTETPEEPVSEQAAEDIRDYLNKD